MATAKKITAAVGRLALAKGNNVFIRTVTNYYTGRVVAMDKEFIHLDRAAWVADTGRFSEAISKGTLNEVEPYPDELIVSVSRGGLIDACLWVHDLPRAVK